MSRTIVWEEMIPKQIWVGTHNGKQVAQVTYTGVYYYWNLKEGMVNGTTPTVRSACNIAGLAYEWFYENIH